MSNKIISFSTNWNNKLENKAFTTIRRNNYYYQIGETYQIELNGQNKGIAKIKRKWTLKAENLNDLTCYLDTGYDKEATIELLKKIYKNIDLQKQQFDLILLIYTGEKPKPKPKEQNLILELQF